MKDKTTIRYIGFRSAKGGGRIFDFSISVAGNANLPISVEIPNELFEGENRIHLQDGVGISYAKLKHLYEIGAPPESPRLRLTASDLVQSK